MEFAPEHIEEIVAHARDEAPNECCGLLAGRNGRSERVFRMANAARSPLRFEVAPLEVMRTLETIDEAGLEVAALYHSHTRTAPYPSQTDVTFAEAWPGTPWIIVGLAEGDAEVRTYRIDGANVAEL
ncbi:MAG: M67 family metallopeptidase [Actinobacteria bacterium]|nr:MAG: M67 family metallopeptidase [Actinomycetota bacterium]